jgi:uncharacterized protein YjiS (DUF1127 family)
MALLSTIAEKFAAWRRHRKRVREFSRVSDVEVAGYRYWTE